MLREIRNIVKILGEINLHVLHKKSEKNILALLEHSFADNVHFKQNFLLMFRQMSPIICKV